MRKNLSYMSSAELVEYAGELQAEVERLTAENERLTEELKEAAE